MRALSDTIQLAKPTLQALALRLSLGSFALVLMVFIHIFIIVRCLWINQLWWFGEEQISKTNTPSTRVYCMEHMDDMFLCPQGGVVYTG